jgi:hypothetical protein
VAALERLIEGLGQTPQQSCPASAFTKSQREALEDLGRRTGALKLRREGRGNVYQVVSLSILRSHLQHLRPQSADGMQPGIPLRAANIAQSRSSKGGAHGHAFHYLLVKAISDDVVWTRPNIDADSGAESAFHLAQATRIAGAGVLAICSDDHWRSDAPLWLVENQALFDRLDWLPSDARGTVAYYAGQLSGRVLAWLAQRQRASEVVIFPDYDGVGLLNYARLLETCCGPCSFWLMPEWPRLLRIYGSAMVWQNTVAEFKTAYPKLVAAGAPQGVLALCEELRAQGLALEHEAVWLQG